MDSPHETLRRFGDPESAAARYEQWIVLVRAEQVAAGPLVLCARSTEEPGRHRLPRATD